MKRYAKVVLCFSWLMNNETMKMLIWHIFMQGQKFVSVYLPGKELWYDLRNGSPYEGSTSHRLQVLEESIPSFQRGGTIVPRKDRFRRSSTQMVNDPYTLVC
jgi:mannosyl-oligosaccharide alpha-1,3-glucosidase